MTISVTMTDEEYEAFKDFKKNLSVNEEKIENAKKFLAKAITLSHEGDIEGSLERPQKIFADVLKILEGGSQ